MSWKAKVDEAYPESGRTFGFWGLQSTMGYGLNGRWPEELEIAHGMTDRGPTTTVKFWDECRRLDLRTNEQTPYLAERVIRSMLAAEREGKRRKTPPDWRAALWAAHALCESRLLVGELFPIALEALGVQHDSDISVVRALVPAPFKPYDLQQVSDYAQYLGVQPDILRATWREVVRERIRRGWRSDLIVPWLRTSIAGKPLQKGQAEGVDTLVNREVRDAILEHDLAQPFDGAAWRATFRELSRLADAQAGAYVTHSFTYGYAEGRVSVCDWVLREVWDALRLTSNDEKTYEEVRRRFVRNGMRHAAEDEAKFDRAARLARLIDEDDTVFARQAEILKQEQPLDERFTLLSE